MATFSQIVQRCVTRLGMVGGTSVQVYAEDILGEMVQARFDEMFQSTWWDDYMVTETDVLIAGGLPTDDPSVDWGLKKFTDIKHVYHKTRPSPLPRTPGRLNPIPYMEQDSSPAWIEPSSATIFRILPYGTVGDSIAVVFRQKPDNFLPDDTVLMDDQALIYGACYDYLEDDGTNPGATEKMRNFYNERLEQLNANRNEQDISLIPTDGHVPDEWQVI